MKKVILLTLAGAISFGSYAQKISVKNFAKSTSRSTTEGVSNFVKYKNVANKTTQVGDTMAYYNYFSTDTLDAYYQSNYGVLFGTNADSVLAAAERYYFDGTDSSVSIIGTVGEFVGVVNPNSTNSLSVKVWSAGPQTAITGLTNVYYSGFPAQELAAKQINFADLNLTTTDVEMFATPTALVSGYVFAGFEMNPYNWSAMNGDTVGLMATVNGERHSVTIGLSGTDTIVNDQNVVKLAGASSWYDVYLAANIKTHLAIAPIFVVNNPVGVKNITKNNLTFFGNYPNPAVNSTNIKFALKNAADVTVNVYDMNGRVINTINQSKLGAGEHTIAVETTNLAAGNYIYMISTSEGDRLASQMSVVK